MEHKGITYTVVQTAAPSGWRWTVELDPPRKSRSGGSITRKAGINKALAVIDGLPPAAPAAPKI